MSKFYVTKRLLTRFFTNGFLSLSTFILVLFLLPLNIYSLDVTLDFDSWAAKIGDSKSGTVGELAGFDSWAGKIGDSKSGTVGDPTFEVKKTDDVITDDCQPAGLILATKLGML